MPYLRDLPKLTHDLKEPLTVIKGFSRLLLDNNSDDLNQSILSKLRDIYTQSEILENKINDIFDITKLEDDQTEYDILVIEDDDLTHKVLIEFFKSRGYDCKCVIDQLTEAAKADKLDVFYRQVKKLESKYAESTRGQILYKYISENNEL